MRFDDRLSTVLGLSAEAPRDRAVQWRQLVELVARGGRSTDPVLLARALERISLLRPEVPETVRASAARAIAGPDVPAGLIAAFAADRLEIAAPLLRAAELDQAGWDTVRQGASADVREMVDTISPPPATSRPAPQERPPSAPPSIGEGGLFRWETGASGEVRWVEGVPRAAAVGLQLAQQVGESFAFQLPFGDERLELAEAGAIAGDWLWTGRPRFDAATGRFEGYSGYARRDGYAGEGSVSAKPVPAPVDGTSLRELIHELRTPLTAIIGFGEIIEGQYLGPAHRAYRDRAGEIVRQARRLLGAVEELDLAAKLGAAKMEASNRGVPLDELVATAVSGLSDRLDKAGVKLQADIRKGRDRVALDPDLLARLVSRFLQAVVDAASAGEQLVLVADTVKGRAALAIDLPAAARNMTEVELLEPAFTAGASDGFGLGFSLRLVRGLVLIAGGSLDVGSDRLTLSLPLAGAPQD